MGIRCADHATPLYPQKLALASPTGGGRSVGIVRLRTKATEFVFICIYHCRSQWPRGLRRRSAAARLLRSWVRIPPGAWMFVCCECCVLSGRSLCDELITRPEESYRQWCVVVCDLEKPHEWGGHNSHWAAAPQEKIYIYVITVIKILEGFPF